MNLITNIQNRIYQIRGERVLPGKDLADLYEVSTKPLNLAVKKNIKRFPDDFMFQLAKEEFETSNLENLLDDKAAQKNWKREVV